MTRTASRTTLLLLAILALLASVVVLDAVDVSAGGSPREQREDARRRKAELARELDVLNAEGTQVEAALADLEANLAAEQGRLAEAERAAAQADRELAEARAAVDAARARLAEVQASLRSAAVDAFINQGSNMTQFDSADINEAARRQALFDSTTNQTFDLLDQLDAARAALEEQESRAGEAAQLAEAKRKTVADRVSQVGAARDQQARVAADVSARVERRLSEAAGLEKLDKSLSAKIAAEERRLAARAPATNSTVGKRFTSGNVPLRTVYGITVHADIADNVKGMLDKARAEGHNFSGGGYRDPQAQWRLRQQNCPDAANSPPSSCRPPTARPGQSMHEQGKAIDFTYNGALIRSRSNAGFQWLNANAGSFGFRNLPSEPWHWSVNGQ